VRVSSARVLGRVGRIKWDLRILSQARIIGLLDYWGFRSAHRGRPGADYRIMGLDYFQITAVLPECCQSWITIRESVDASNPGTRERSSRET